MSVKVNSETADCEFIVVRLTNAKTLLGLQSSRQLNILQINSVDSIEGNDLIQEYNDIFTGLGKVEGKFTIKTSPDVTPVIHPARKVPLSLLPKLKETLNRLVEAGVISKVESPTEWVNSMVIVEKKNGSLRICIDARELNNSILRQYNTIPTPEEISSKLHGCSVFTVIDMADCYWHIELDNKSSELCTFNTPFGRHKFNRLPFGISCASDAAQAMVAKYFGDIPGVTAIHDDLIIGAVTTEEHDTILRKVFQRARENNIKFNLKKIQYRVPSVTYLGNIVSSKGLQPDPSKIEAILGMPKPEDKESLHRFLGMVNFLGQFIPNLSEITAPLRSLLKKETLWQWNHEHDTAIFRINSILSSQPVLSFFDINLPVNLQVDASSHGLGACLMQNDHPISYASRSLNQSERNYAQIEKELLAIVFGCERFNQYLYGREVQISSDHKPLQYILKKPLATAPPRIQRLLIRLQKYQVNVEYMPGKYLHIADTLSRAHLPATGNDNDIAEDSEIMIHTVSINLPLSPTKRKELELCCNSDPQMLMLKEHIKNGTWPEQRKYIHDLIKPFWHVRFNLHIVDDIVMKDHKVVIPTDMQQQVLSIIHSSHLGADKSKARGRSTVYWPGMGKMIEEMTASCSSCLEHRSLNQKEPMTIHEIPRIPWTKIGSDLFELDGKPYIAVIDYYSKFIEMSRVPDKHSSTIIKILKSIFVRHGIPIELIADNMPFNSSEMNEFAREYGFTISPSSPRYPQSNGMSEMAVRICKRILKKCDDPALGLLEYSNTPLTGMEYSPCQLLMCRTTRTKLPICEKLLEPAIPQHAYETMTQLKLKQKEYYDRSSKSLPEIYPNEIVRIRKPTAPDVWSRAIVAGRSNHPNSFIVNTEDGRTYRRNRRHLLKSIEKGPLVSDPVNNIDFNWSNSNPVHDEQNAMLQSPQRTPVPNTPPENSPHVENVPVRRSTRPRTKPPKLNDYAR